VDAACDDRVLLLVVQAQPQQNGSQGRDPAPRRARRQANCSKKVNGDGVEMCRCPDFAAAQQFRVKDTGQLFFGCSRWRTSHGCG